MSKVLAIGTNDTSGVLKLVEIDRRAVGDDDVSIKVKYTGICHSDIHHSKDEWGLASKPAVPGHEVVGTVLKVGKNVKKFTVGQTVGVGCFVDSCRKCPECSVDDIQYCSGKREGGFPGLVNTYGSPLLDVEKHTKGGYSQEIVVTQDFVLSIPQGLDPIAAAPLLCAGITVYSPIVHYGVKKGDNVAVLGLGGLGHMAVKFLKAMGCTVSILSRSDNKKNLALKLGAEKVLLTGNENVFKENARSFNFIIDTVSAKHDLNQYLGLLKTGGTIILVGASPEGLNVHPFSLIPRRTKIGGSLVGGIKETQEMLEFCAKHNIVSDIELVGVDYVNKAWERVLKSDVLFRFVLDIEKTLVPGVEIKA